MHYFKHKLLDYSQADQFLFLLDNPQVQPIDCAGSIKNSHLYVDEMINEYTVRMSLHPQLTAKQQDLSFYIHTQKKKQSSIFEIEQVKRKQLKRKIIKKNQISNKQLVKQCLCCQTKYLLKHKCDHSLCQKPCLRLKKSNRLRNAKLARDKFSLGHSDQSKDESAVKDSQYQNDNQNQDSDSYSSIEQYRIDSQSLQSLEQMNNGKSLNKNWERKKKSTKRTRGRGRRGDQSNLCDQQKNQQQKDKINMGQKDYHQTCKVLKNGDPINVKENMPDNAIYNGNSVIPHPLSQNSKQLKRQDEKKEGENRNSIVSEIPNAYNAQTINRNSSINQQKSIQKQKSIKKKPKKEIGSSIMNDHQIQSNQFQSQFLPVEQNKKRGSRTRGEKRGSTRKPASRSDKKPKQSDLQASSKRGKISMSAKDASSFISSLSYASPPKPTKFLKDYCPLEMLFQGQIFAINFDKQMLMEQKKPVHDIFIDQQKQQSNRQQINEEKNEKQLIGDKNKLMTEQLSFNLKKHQSGQQQNIDTSNMFKKQFVISCAEHKEADEFKDEQKQMRPSKQLFKVFEDDSPKNYGQCQGANNKQADIYNEAQLQADQISEIDQKSKQQVEKQ